MALLGGDSLARRLAARIVEVGDCWEWVGGYSDGGRRPAVDVGGKSAAARRVVYERVTGRSIDGKCLRTKCGNFRCVNPHHALAVSKLEQIKIAASAAAAVNKRLNVITNAGALKTRKLTDAEVAYIRSSGKTAAQLAGELGVSKTTVQNVRAGAHYRDVWYGVFSRLIRNAA